MATSPSPRPGLPSPEIATASLLESLPPAMLDEILSRLPIRDAARTSALSRFWRRRWKSVPYKALHWPTGTPAFAINDVLDHRAYHVLRFPSGIDGVLTHPTSCPVGEFRHPHVPEQEFRLSNGWLFRLASVGVHSLSIKFQRSEVGRDERAFTFPQIRTLHPTIFSCHQLALLELEGCDIPGRPPLFGGFPNLTTLSLSHVGFPILGVRELEGLISSSPLLRTLRLENLRFPDAWPKWVIHAPNLQRLLISSEFDEDGWQIDDLPAIEVADISWTYYSDDRDFVDLVSVFDKATRLKLSTPQSMRNAMEGLSRPFVNLKSLSLHIPYRSPYNILAIFYLVRNAPKLEDLDIEHGRYPLAQGRVDTNSLNVPWADDLFSSLTSVKMKNVIWDAYERLFMEFILSKARQLEVFSIQESRHRLKSDEDALEEVKRYRRASHGANVVINRMP